MSEQNAQLSMYGQDILCGISKVSCPYIERYDFNTMLKLQELPKFHQSFKERIYEIL